MASISMRGAVLYMEWILGSYLALTSCTTLNDIMKFNNKTRIIF